MIHLEVFLHKKTERICCFFPQRKIGKGEVQLCEFDQAKGKFADSFETDCSDALFIYFRW